MPRERPRAGILLLAVLLLGIASSAGATLLGSGGCCQGMEAMGGAAGRSAPCAASLAPGSCCEERVPAQAAQAAHAPVLATALATAPDLAAPSGPALSRPCSTRLPARCPATVVLRL